MLLAVIDLVATTSPVVVLAVAASIAFGVIIAQRICTVNA